VQAVAFKSTPYARGTKSWFLKASLRCKHKQLLYKSTLRWRYKHWLSKGIPTIRCTSRGSVWLSWQTLLHRRYSALKPTKYQTLSLQVSNAGVLEQATAYISLVTLHCTFMKHQRLPCLNSACTVTWNNPRFWTH